MNFFKPRLEILPDSQRAILPQLAPARKLGFTLYGGTAIALRLGHRQSIDFDFFTERPLDKAALRKTLELLESSEVIQDEAETLSVLVGGVKVSFFGGLSFGRYGEVGVTLDEVLSVASLDDLLALKIKVLFQRSESKDYLDIAALLSADVSLERGLATATQMFRPDLSPAIALKALTYFEGGDLTELSEDCKRVILQAVRSVSELPVVTQLSPSLAG